MQKETYNEFYKKHGVSIHTDPIRFREISKLCKNKVLDIGCGTGDLADFFKGEYLGIDISNVAIEMAEKTKRTNAEFLTLDPTKAVAEPMQNYDTIVMAEFLEHIDNDKALFENIKIWATPNARLIISVPNGDRVPDENHLRQFTVPELRKRFLPLGKVKFHNWSGFNKRILLTVDLGQKSEDEISLVMIIRNEAKGLERCILSCIEIVDNIVLSVDENNEDKSFEIAKRYGDVVKTHQWKDDFSAARNFAKEGVNSKWILSLDGHEFVSEFGNIEEMLKSDVEGLMITVKMDGGDKFITNRIFRSHLVWNHAIHNVISCKTTGKLTDFLIIHDREGGQGLKAYAQRKEQVRVMMERELLKEAKMPEYKQRAFFYLARYYMTFHDWKKAIKYYKKYLKLGKHKGEMWLACIEAGTLATALKKPLMALDFLRQAEELLPNRWETAQHIGLAYMSFEQWEKAINYLVNSFKINTGEFSYNPRERDNANTWDKIGFCWYQLGKYNQAKVSWERAIELEKNPDKIQLNKKRIELIDRNIII